MVTIVGVAMIREFSEIILYLQGYASAPEIFPRVLTGGVVGAGVGFSVGVMLYYLLGWGVSDVRRVYRLQWVLSLVVAGILLQAVSLLMQVDYLPHQSALWDSSALIPENSIVGQLLYALVGYEASPNAWHLGAYVVGLTALLALVGLRPSEKMHG